jgi:integral membrane protein
MWGLGAAATRFRVMAWLTGVVLGALTVWLVVGYGFLDYANTDVKPGLYRNLWTAHGWLYFIYLIVGVDLAFRLRYPLGKTVLILLAGTVPFMSFVAERFVHKDVAARIATATPN